MTPSWQALDSELTRWNDTGLTLPLWWRDDDAIQPTAALERLIALSDTVALPVHLAVIPRDVTQALADHVKTTSARVLVHGWAHTNHAPQGEKKAEFGAHRPISAMRSEIKQSLPRLRGLFGSKLDPVFVPPWNRITVDLAPVLTEIGFTALSTFKPRKATFAASGLAQINTHLDPIHWKGDRSLVPAQDLIDQVEQQLRDRREGRADNTEPYGILTHHLVHDAAIWEFTQTLIERLMTGPGQAWTFTAKDN
ncbi:MAG: polysaccharide deacetylase [Rhodobacteraceae bacterium]|nr:polysaccharide deacetylase [Paracoccaceae bacterium]